MFTEYGNEKHKTGEIIDNIEQADYICGGEDYILTDEDIKVLKDGKIINFDVNWEYGCTLRYEPKVIDKHNAESEV